MTTRMLPIVLGTLLAAGFGSSAVPALGEGIAPSEPTCPQAPMVHPVPEGCAYACTLNADGCSVCSLVCAADRPAPVTACPDICAPGPDGQLRCTHAVCVEEPPARLDESSCMWLRRYCERQNGYNARAERLLKRAGIVRMLPEPPACAVVRTFCEPEATGQR
jgi:hypothetical protein